MEITEVRIKLMDDPNDRLQGFCSITFDACFVIRDLKIIQGSRGSFVAMPSRKLTDRCPKCGTKNQLRARFCNDCGVELEEDRAVKDDDGRAKLYADIAHPINSRCRDMIQKRVLESFENEKILARQPGYRCTYDDYGEDRVAKLKEMQAEVASETPVSTPEPGDDTSEMRDRRKFRIDGPDESFRRVDSADSDAAGPHHLKPSGEKEKAVSEAGSDSEDFGAGV